MDKHETEDIHEEIFELRTANECLMEASGELPKMLLGDLWLTGELSVMFAEAGAGKSLFAVEVAASIARGKAIEPFEMTAGAQKVLYIDLEQSAVQFARRYTAEIDPPADAKAPRKVSKVKKHCFSDNFIRPVINGAAELKAAQLEPMIAESRAKVIIIDNIAYLQRYSIPRETAAVMRELRRLRNRYGLSILVLTHTARSVPRRGLAAADMACSSVMVNFADNIFAIGHSRADSSARYIKHIKPGAAALAFGSAHLPWFRIAKRGGTFPAFEFQGYRSEAALSAGDGDSYEWSTIREIKRKSEVDGANIRQIAADLNMSKSTVHRYLKMAPEDWANELEQAQAEPSRAEPVFFMFEKCIYERCFGCSTCSGRAANKRFSVPGNIYGHDDCPDDCDICGPRRYGPHDKADPHLKQLSDTHYEQLREWLIAGKSYPRPVYPGARRYGSEKYGWQPGTESSPEEELDDLVSSLM